MRAHRFQAVAQGRRAFDHARAGTAEQIAVERDEIAALYRQQRRISAPQRDAVLIFTIQIAGDNRFRVFQQHRFDADRRRDRGQPGEDIDAAA